MGGEQGPPPMGQTGQLAACDRNKGTVVSAARQLVEHVEPLPYSLPEDLAQNLVHLCNSTFPCSACARLLAPQRFVPRRGRSLQPRSENFSPDKSSLTQWEVAPEQGRQSPGLD